MRKQGQLNKAAILAALAPDPLMTGPVKRSQKDLSVITGLPIVVVHRWVTRLHADGRVTVDMGTPVFDLPRIPFDAAGLQPSDIDLIILATSTPDMVFPSTACIVQNKLGIVGCPAFDVQAVCTGFVYALTVADNIQFRLDAGTRHALIGPNGAGKTTFVNMLTGRQVFTRNMGCYD